MSGAEIQFPVADGNDGSVDWGHFNQMTLGDYTLGREVLALFDAQAANVMNTVRDLPANAGMLLHGLKGASRSIGAWDVAAAAQELENRLNTPRDTSVAVETLIERVSEVRTAIAPYI